MRRQGGQKPAAMTERLLLSFLGLNCSRYMREHPESELTRFARAYIQS